MPRPRILSSYNYKRRNANVKREDAGPINHIKMEVTKIEREEPDCEIIMIDDDDDDDNNDNDKNIGGGKDGKIRSVTATKAPVTIEVRRENTVELVDTEKLTRRMPLETKEAVTALCQNSSLSLQLVANTSSKAAQSMTSLSADVVQLIPNTSSRSARSVTGLSSDVVQLIPNSSTKVFHLIPNSSDGVARLVNNSSKRSTQLITNSSARVGQFVTGSSARVPRLVPCSSPRVTQMVPGSSARVAQLVPGSSARVAQLVTSSSARVPQLVPCSSARVAQLVTSSSARVPQLVTSSSARVPQLVTSSSARVPQLVPNTSARVPQLVPNTSARVPQLVPNSSARVPQLVPNSSARVPQLVPNSSARVPQLVPNSSARVPQLVPNSAARLTQLSPGSSARFAQLITNSSAQVMQLVPNASAKFAQFVPNSNAKSSNRITQLIQISPARETQLSSGLSAKLTPPIPNSSEKCTQPLTKSSAKFAQLVPKSSEKLTSKSPNDRNNSNVVMVSPVSATDTNIFQSPTICTLEKIRNLKELTRVRQVVGVPRRNNAAQSITSQQNNLSLPRNVVQQINEAKRASEMRKENFHKLHSDDTSESRKRMTEIHHVPWSEEKSQEEKFFAESQKTLIPVSRETTVDAFGIAKRALSLAKKAATKGPQARVKLVDVRKMMNKPGNTGKQARNLDKIEENVKIESYDDKTTGKSVKTSKSTILVNRRKNIRLNARKNQKNPKLSVLSRIQSRLTKALSGLDHPARNKWRAQCIVCKSRFTDKYEFHRHATLSHPGIRIVFCELCSSSFRTDDELRQHRSSYHKITVIKDAEGNLTTIEPPEETTRTTTTTIETVVKRENESQRPRTIKKERKALNRKKMTNDNRGNADSVAGHSRTSEIFRPRLTKKKVAGSSVRARNWKKMSQTGSTYNGVRRRRPQTKNKTAKSTYNYVDVDVIRYDAIATKNKFKSAEIKKLIVPLTRLEGPVLEKYLKKYDTSPVMNFTSIILKKSRDTLGNNEKSLISTNSKKTAINSGSRIANEKSAKKSIKLYTEKVRKNRRSRSNETENFTISHDSTIVIDSNRSNENVEPRRSMRRRRANKFLYSDSDDSTDDDSTNIHSLDNDEERTKNQLSTRERKSQKVGIKKFDTKIRTGQDFTSIEIDETEKIAEIVKEQRVIRKLISRSSVSSSVTLENNRDKNFPNTEKRLETDDGDTEMSYSPLRNISIYTSSDDNPLTESTRPKKLQTTTSKCSKSKQTSSSDEEASRDYVNFEKSRNLPSKGSERSSGEEVPLSNRVKFQQSRLLRANSSKSSNSEETLNSDKVRSESSRYLLRKNLTERDLSKNPTVLGKCDGATDETTRKIDKKAAEDKLIGGKNDGEDNEVKETNDEENNRRKEKIDNENKQSNEKNDSEKNEQKDQINDDEKQTKGNSNDANKRETEKSDDEGKQSNEKSDDEGKKSKEKSDGEGERSREKSDDEEKKSNVVEKKANEKTNDGDKQSEERIDDEDKEQKEKIDDEDKESKEKSDGEGKQSKENADGEGKQSKENSDGEGKQSKEKTDGEGEQSREKTDGEGKQSKEKSSGVEKQQNEKSDDGDKQPEERIDDEDKEPMEKIDDEDKEPNEETDDENEGPEVKIDNENERLNEKINDNGKKQLIDRNNSKNARQSRDKNKDKKHLKDMNNGDNKKRPKDKNNGEPKKLKEKHDYTRETISRGPFESTVRKTYSSGKKPSKASKCLKQLWQREKSSDFTNSQDLCIVCKELFALMKKISSQVPERNTSETPIKCPSCQRYFISMFHLELHVATNHLRCRNKVSCKKLQLSTIEKLSQDDVIDCQTELEIAIECSRCTLKFTSEKDLNDHLIKQHETPTLRDASSSNESPEYLKDLRNSCFQTIFGEKIGPSTRQNNESTDRRENVKNTLDNSTSEIEKNRIPTVDCSLCDEKFVKITEYVCHVRQRHHIFKRSSLTNSEKNSDKTANSTEPQLFGKEESSLGVSRTLNDDEINLSLKHNPNDQMSADREYVLKQLLSDDSNDDENEKISKINPSCHRESSKRTLQETTRKKITDESAKGTVVGYLSSLHTCKVCRKTFTRAQDLLMHGLHHLDSEISMMSDDNIDNLSEKKSNKRRQELFVDSMSNDHGENIEDFATTPYEEFDPTTRDGFADCSENESDNVAVVYGYDGASEKVLFGSKRRATSPLDESPKVTSNEVKPIRSKKRKICATEKISRDKSYCSPEQQSRSAKNDTMRELMETEMGLAGETNDKLPIACGKCNRHFANRSLLNEHLFFLHDDTLKDTVLTDVLPPTSSLTGTVEGASSKQRLQCETCLQNFKLLQGYSRHRYFAHGDDSMVHVCENCSKVLTNVTMVNVHICTDMASYNCRTCDEKFSTGMSLRLHNMEKHPETEGPHVCEPCEKNFLTRAMLERHEKSKHRLSRPYRARKSSPVRMSINDEDMEKMSSDNVEKRDNATSEELDSGCDENCDGEIDSSITIEPIKSRRGRWRACRNKTITRNELPVERKRPRINRTPGKRRRGRPRKYPSTDEESPYQSSQDDEENSEKDPKIDDVWRESTLFIDETEINQCSLCQLYCLTKSALRNHMVKIHSTPDEVCQLCQKMYPAGKLIRHMIDRHISSDDCRITRYETGWQIGTNSNEIDTEIFVRMLGIRRLVSLCEYRRYTENIVPASYKCPYCVKTFPSNELYRYHFLLNHDEMCALCNIEYKKGHDAARHKSEIHGSVGRYIWFADRTIMAVMSTKNFAHVAESIFIEMLTRDDDDDNEDDDETVDDETDDSFDEDDLENLDCTEILVYSTIDENNVRIVNEIETCHEDRINLTKEIFGTIRREEDTNRGETRLVEGTSLTKENIGRIKNEEQTRIVEDTNLSKEMVGNVENDKNTGSTITSETRTRREIDATLSFKSIPRTTREKETMKDDRSIVSDDFAEADDVQMIIVVTDEDLERFNITTRHPNIWGLSAKISSTFDGITPKEVKEILERYFERQEDFDT